MFIIMFIILHVFCCRLDLVDLPSHDVITYKLAKVCCDGDTQCKESESLARYFLHF